MEKVDLKKEFKHLYKPSAKEVVEVEVPTFNYLMIDGEGDPNTSQEYVQAVEALFSVSYTAKFMVKKGVQALDYAVMPLEVSGLFNITRIIYKNFVLNDIRVRCSRVVKFISP